MIFGGEGSDSCEIIQIDTGIGEVRRIGIRACVIRTVDGLRSHSAKWNNHLQKGNQLDSIGLVPRNRSVSHRGSRRGDIYYSFASAGEVASRVRELRFPARGAEIPGKRRARNE